MQSDYSAHRFFTDNAPPHQVIRMPPRAILAMAAKIRGVNVDSLSLDYNLYNFADRITLFVYQNPPAQHTVLQKGFLLEVLDYENLFKHNITLPEIKHEEIVDFVSELLDIPKEFFILSALPESDQENDTILIHRFD